MCPHTDDDVRTSLRRAHARSNIRQGRDVLRSATSLREEERGEKFSALTRPLFGRPKPKKKVSVNFRPSSCARFRFRLRSAGHAALGVPKRTSNERQARPVPAAERLCSAKPPLRCCRARCLPASISPSHIRLSPILSRGLSEHFDCSYQLRSIRAGTRMMS